jgi:regulator of protease activity HflC (stomatin/prohibitin superfamily)
MRGHRARRTIWVQLIGVEIARRKGNNMLYVAVGLAVAVLVGVALSIRILKQYERGVQFRLGRVETERVDQD